MALGADAATTLRLVLGKSMMLVAGGTACGLVASFAITRAIGGLLYDVSPLDPMVFAGVSSLLAAAGFLASGITFPSEKGKSASYLPFDNSMQYNLHFSESRGESLR